MSRRIIEENLSLIQEVIQYTRRRQRFSPEDGEEFSSWALVKLMENDGAVLAKYQGRSSLKTYLTTVIQRLALDYRIQEWGKWRPSASAKELGPDAVRLEMLTHRDGLSQREAVETILSSGESRSSEAELEAMVRELPVRLRKRLEGEEVLEHLVANDRGAEANVARRDRDKARRATEAALNGALRRLASEQRLILKMRFADGLQVRQIADALGVSAKGLYRKLERLAAHLRSEMESAGVTASDVASFVGEKSKEIVLDFRARGDE
jgi:RNA polymerase sigma factor (sigma-70 family)